LHKNEQEPYEDDTSIMYYKDEIVGWFELLEITTPTGQVAQETVIHKSKIRWGANSAINAGATDGIEMVGIIQDTSVPFNKNNGWFTMCDITLTIMSNTTPIQAEWIVELIHPAFGSHFNVPTNITMTKIN